MATADEISQWRSEAKALRASVVAGDDAALDRVLAAHPKYTGRTRDRLDDNRARFSLRDAQWTIARERGRENWNALCDQGRHWPVRTFGPQQGRALRIALELGDEECGPQHLLLALASPRQPTTASDVLGRVGGDLAKLRDLRPRQTDRGGRRRARTTPSCTLCVGAAATLAIAQGADRVTDEHVLLAIAYTLPDLLHGLNIDPDEIYDMLAAGGVPLPAVRPPADAEPRGPYNPVLYVSRADLRPILDLLRTRHPPGTASWGFNYSTDTDEAHVISEDEIDIEAIAREALGPEGTYRLERRDDVQRTLSDEGDDT
jgi:hypothetical protein